MKKIISTFLIFISFICIQAQYGAINEILSKLEQKLGVNQDLKDVNIDGKKFYLVNDFEDHTERSFIIIKGKAATYVEIFDDKKTGESVSNVFSGDILRTKRNIISLRADQLEGKKIPIPVTKNLLMTRQKKIIYLIDINSKERWIDESSISKK